MDLTWLAEMLLNVRKWLGYLSERRSTKKRLSEKDYEDALTALYTALNETQIYIGTKQRNQKREGALSRLWTAAAVKIRSYDVDLAERCCIKGVYWTNPESWSDDDIEKARIAIDAVMDSARELL